MQYLFEEYVFDTDRRELHRGTDSVPVAPQVFDLLYYLIRNRERVVSKQDLGSAIWNGRIVTGAALTTRLNVARSVIGDSGEEQRLIKTLPRKGFRFVGRVREAPEPMSAAAAAEGPDEPPKPGLPLPDRPSIAVLPFENMSGDAEQEYFADGMVDDIITALSRFKLMFVIARNSSFAYKGKTVDIKQVGRELGVRYVLEGSVRKAAGKLRITGQLIDATTGAHLWADRFEGDLSDVFALQDKVTENVVGSIQPKLLQTEINLAARRPNDLSAYDLCLRALSHFRSATRDGSAEALRLVSRALQIDPRYGFAAILAGSCHLQNVGQGWATDRKSEITEGIRLLRLALSIDGNNAEALSSLGRSMAFFSGDFDTAKDMVDRAVALNPNAVLAWDHRGWIYQLAGHPEEAIRSFERAVRISPFDPSLVSIFTGMSVALISLGRFEDAIAAARKVIIRDDTAWRAYLSLVAALTHLGRKAEATKAVARLLELEPDFHISEWMARGVRLNARQLIDGLRKAGLPE